MNELAQFLTYLIKVFALNRVVRTVRDSRPYPKIPTRPLLLSLLLGVVIRDGREHGGPAAPKRSEGGWTRMSQRKAAKRHKRRKGI